MSERNVTKKFNVVAASVGQLTLCSPNGAEAALRELAKVSEWPADWETMAVMVYGIRFLDSELKPVPMTPSASPINPVVVEAGGLIGVLRKANRHGIPYVQIGNVSLQPGRGCFSSWDDHLKTQSAAVLSAELWTEW